MASIDIPSQLEEAFRQFSRDFNAVTRHWVERGEETPETVATAREGLREYLSMSEGVSEAQEAREQRLRDVFAFWRELVMRLPRPPIALVAVVPSLSDQAETRIADRWWNRQQGNRA